MTAQECQADLTSKLEASMRNVRKVMADMVEQHKTGLFAGGGLQNFITTHADPAVIGLRATYCFQTCLAAFHETQVIVNSQFGTCLLLFFSFFCEFSPASSSNQI